MKIELDKRYKDRKGRVWRIIEIKDRGLHPVTGAQWNGVGHATRTFQRDGRFFANADAGPDDWDLIEEVANEPVREGS